jgi:hypothetical protein
MWRQDGQREVDEQAAKAADPEPPASAPAVAPGSLAWASAVGNNAVARYAQGVARAPKPEEGVDEEAAPPAEAAAPGPADAAAPKEEDEEAEEELPE